MELAIACLLALIAIVVFAVHSQEKVDRNRLDYWIDAVVSLDWKMNDTFDQLAEKLNMQYVSARSLYLDSEDVYDSYMKYPELQEWLDTPENQEEVFMTPHDRKVVLDNVRKFIKTLEDREPVPSSPKGKKAKKGKK